MIRATGYARIVVPDDLPAGPAPALVVVHGYGQPPEQMLAYARSVAPPGVVLVAPEGPAAFYRNPRAIGGAARGGVRYGWIADPDRASAEDRNSRLLDAALDAAAARHPLDPRRTVLLAFSQGVGVAVHFWLGARQRVAGLVALAGGVREALRPALARLVDAPVLWIHGTRDHAYPPAYVEPVLDLLRAATEHLEVVALDEGHDLLERARPAVARWLARRLPRGTEAR